MENLITLKATASCGTDDQGKNITILQIEGDPLNLANTGTESLKIEVMLASSATQCVEDDASIDFTPAGDAERRRKYVEKHGIMYSHLACVIGGEIIGPCNGPECPTYIGLDYDKCPNSH